ncbi:Os11g0439900 [Oryza sativa Japonica Group]|uniref:Os11g0439900 protein n=1 Tax=Oryza sativa subsp. japonica TaxID=39947 RepID=A0A0N7KSV4_ORYSJ|nr:Os11g0439900 [Oryza sativa Japonica Group]
MELFDLPMWGYKWSLGTSIGNSYSSQPIKDQATRYGVVRSPHVGLQVVTRDVPILCCFISILEDRSTSTRAISVITSRREVKQPAAEAYVDTAGYGEISADMPCLQELTELL